MAAIAGMQRRPIPAEQMSDACESPSHVPPNQDGQGKKVHGIIFIRVQEPKRVFDIKFFLWRRLAAKGRASPACLTLSETWPGLSKSDAEHNGKAPPKRSS